LQGKHALANSLQLVIQFACACFARSIRRRQWNSNSHDLLNYLMNSLVILYSPQPLVIDLLRTLVLMT